MKKSVTSAVSRQIALSVCDYACFLGKDLTEQQRLLFARWSTLSERQKGLLLELMETM